MGQGWNSCTQLAMTGFDVLEMPPDGNCLYHALSTILLMQLNILIQPENLKHLLKWSVATHYLSTPESLEVGEPDFRKRYYKREQWGGLPEIIAFVELFQCRVIVYRIDEITEKVRMWSDLKPNHYMDGVVSSSAVHSKGYLLYDDHHFDVLKLD